MINVNVHEAKTTLSALLVAVEEKGESILICRNGKPVAKLVPITENPVNHFKCNPRLKVVFHENPMTPVPPEAWPEECR